MSTKARLWASPALVLAIYLLQPEAEHIAELHHLVIRPQSQRQGIGEKTIKAIAAELLKEGFSEFRVAHHPEEQKAGNFYKKLGFFEHGNNYDDDVMLSIKLSELV